MYHSNDRIGPYKLVRMLGCGTFGEVWLAQKSVGISPQVAIKIPKETVAIDLDALKREATLWVQASGHSNIVPIIEAAEYDQRFIIVSEYVAGGSLERWLEQHVGRAPSIEAATGMVSGILTGLAHLHVHSIVHRDLKLI